MGCCSSEPRLPNEAALLGKIRCSIEANNAERLSSYSIIHENMSNCSSKILSDTPIINIKSISLSCLGYSLWLGHLKTFRFLYEKKQADIVVMEDHFNQNSTSGIDILVQRKYSEFLEYYLPIYLEHYQKMKKSHKSPFTIHTVVESGNITLLSVIEDGTKGRNDLPKELDVHAVNEETGENSALVACKLSNLAILKYLIEKCKVNFNIKDNKGNGAVGLILSSRNDKETKLHCLNLVLKLGKIEIPDNFPELDPDFQHILAKHEKEISLHQ